MTLRNLLNLRPQKEPKVIVIEKVILAPRSIKSELLRILLVIGVVSAITLGISRADTITQILKGSSEASRTFSTRGHISEINGTTIVINNAKNPDGETGYSYTVDLSNTQIKSYTGSPLMITDVQTNQEVLAKGSLEGETIVAYSLIIFGEIQPLEVSTTTATTTDDFATTTDATSTTTIDISTTTSTTTDDTSSTTDPIINETPTTTSTTTPEESSSTDATSTNTIIDTITETIGDVIDTVVNVVSDTVDTITGNNPPPQEETPPPPQEVQQPEPTPETTTPDSPPNIESP